MKIRKMCSLLVLFALTASLLASCTVKINDNKLSDSDKEQSESELSNASSEKVDGDDNTVLSFRPVDCGIQSQSVYEYPFTGMSFTLSQKLLNAIDSREVFVYTDEDYISENALSYAYLCFSSTTSEQREEEVMSLDIITWQSELEKIGTVGVFSKDCVNMLDELTLCDVHTKIGESANGEYEYYISTNSSGNAEFAQEIENTEITIGEMHELDLYMGYSAFSSDRLDNVDSVGEFSAKDIFDNTYTQEMFENYDLTLVNVFATWCSPCVEEMPVLESLRCEYEQKGIKLGVVAVVMDTKTENGVDENALELAKTLYERSGANFPFIIPDDTVMNGRLIGIESFPESFFVDSNGNIVSEPYIGANTQRQWEEIVDSELASLSGQ